MDFLDILLEAKGDRKKTPTTKLKATPAKTTDYNAEEEDQDDDVDTPEENEDDTDTTEDDDTDVTTDYTEEEDESDPDEDGADDTDGEDGDESTDYTAEEDGDGDSEGDGDEDTTDDSTDGETDDTTEEDEADTKNENDNNRVLLEDFSNLYFVIKNTITKLSSIDKSNILINKIVTQISSNLNVLNKQLFDFITFTFPKGKYVTNLYKYNYFLEAFRLNVEMLKKISIFIPN